MESFHQVFPPKPCMHLSCPSYCYMPCPTRASWFDDLINIWWWVESVKLLTVWSSQLPCYIVPLRLQYFPQHLLNTLSLCSSLNVRNQTLHPYKTRGKFTILCTLIYIFWIANWKIKDSAPNDSKDFLTSNCSGIMNFPPNFSLTKYKREMTSSPTMLYHQIHFYACSFQNWCQIFSTGTHIVPIL